MFTHLQDSLTLMQLIGVAGSMTYLVSFALLQFGSLDGNSRAYTLLNITAATLVLMSLTEAFNLASAVIQVSWIAIGVGSVVWRRARA